MTPPPNLTRGPGGPQPSGPRPVLLGPYTRPLHRDPAAWCTLALVAAATVGNAVRAWSESSSASATAAIAALTLVLSSITTVFLVAIVVGIPRGWRAGRGG